MQNIHDAGIKLFLIELEDVIYMISKIQALTMKIADFIGVLLMVTSSSLYIYSMYNPWDKVYPLQVTVPPMGGNGRLLR